MIIHLIAYKMHLIRDIALISAQFRLRETIGTLMIAFLLFDWSNLILERSILINNRYQFKLRVWYWKWFHFWFYKLVDNKMNHSIIFPHNSWAVISLTLSHVRLHKWKVQFHWNKWKRIDRYLLVDLKIQVRHHIWVSIHYLLLKHLFDGLTCNK
jgi:hypothetical protein